MGIFNRFVNVLRANTNAALDKAEDPELMLTQMVSDLETQKKRSQAADDGSAGLAETLRAPDRTGRG
jgi:phage shock protein A